MRSGPHIALLFALAALLAATVPGAAPATARADIPADGQPVLSAPTVGQAEPANETLEPGRMTIRVSLQADGDARWIVSRTFRLEDANDTAAFERLAREFREDGAERGFSLETAQLALERARNATGREMTIRGINRSTSVRGTGENRTGTLRLAFTWGNFAITESDELRVGDAFNTSNGTWFSYLGPDQRLIIETPPGYGVFDGPKAVEQGALRWEGPETFEAGELRIVYTGNVPTTTTSGSDGDGTTTSPPPTDDDLSLAALAGLFLIGIGVLALATYLVSRRTDLGPSSDDGGVTEADGGGADGGAGAVPEGAGTASSDQVAEPPVEEPDDGIDPELLSDEERVEHLLQRNGGRMKQANIVKETGWSNAKVSQLLSSMDEEERIDKLRIGRENLISLPDEDVTDLDEE